MGETHIYVVVGQGKEYRIEADGYRTNEGKLMLFVDDSDEPVAKFLTHGWESIYRENSGMYKPENS